MPGILPINKSEIYLLDNLAPNVFKPVIKKRIRNEFAFKNHFSQYLL